MRGGRGYGGRVGVGRVGVGMRGGNTPGIEGGWGRVRSREETFRGVKAAIVITENRLKSPIEYFT